MINLYEQLIMAFLDDVTSNRGGKIGISRNFLRYEEPGGREVTYDFCGNCFTMDHFAKFKQMCDRAMARWDMEDKLRQ